LTAAWRPHPHQLSSSRQQGADGRPRPRRTHRKVQPAHGHRRALSGRLRPRRSQLRSRRVQVRGRRRDEWRAASERSLAFSAVARPAFPWAVRPGVRASVQVHPRPGLATRLAPIAAGIDVAAPPFVT
jgi:hypothetical protein